MDEQLKNLEQLLNSISLEKIVAIAVLMLVAWLFLVTFHWLLEKLKIQFPRNRLLLNRIYPLTRVLVWSSAVVYAVVGIIAPHSSILFAMLGSAGLALGLATQEPMKNMVSGLIIMINPPYRVGDMVKLAGHYGEVIKLEWSVTWLKTFDDNTIMVPNAEALKTAVCNSNSGALDEQVSVKFSLPIHCDHQRAMALAREATLCSPYTFLKKPVLVHLESGMEYGKALIHITVKAWVMDVRLEKRFATDVQLRVLDAYKVAGLVQPEVTELPAASPLAAS